MSIQFEMLKEQSSIIKVIGVVIITLRILSLGEVCTEVIMS
jgi:hypothetical protein